MTSQQLSTHPRTMASRRRFLQTASAVVAGGVMSRAGFAHAASEMKPVAEPESKTLASRLGVASYSFRKFNLDQTIAMTKRLRMKYLCLKSFHLPLDAKPEVLRAAAERIKKEGLVFDCGGTITMANQAQIDEAFEYAKHAGLKIMVIAPTAKMLPAIERKVVEYDIAVGIHNHGPGDKHFPTPGSAYDKIKNLDPRVGLCVDVGHTVRYGDDPYAAIETCADRVYDFHLKDVTSATAKGTTTILGRGVIDMPRLFATLKRINYSGVLSLEYESEANDPLPSIAESAGYARGMLAAMDA
ncbi:MAG: sugar phosphate isomerase/epimerase [Pirellulaceae bacterium]|nr:sugar phosphate isomerase/epimerase [Pirellulaceae bacterium]